MQIEPLTQWGIAETKPWVISGPCSAETEDQLTETALALVEKGVKTIRAGVWKPRTRPGSFEGIGQDALGWINNIRTQVPSDVKFAIEVATPQHVEQALKAGIDILWLGARSSVNPFTVQDIADSLKGVDVPVLVKNPINPDLALWIGALERIAGAGITKLGAIHRGFSSHKKSKFRNIPSWHIALDLKRELPEIPMICDPSHIAGNSAYIAEISQKAMDLDFDGLMIESHRSPVDAWSDAKQQVTPDVLASIVDGLSIRSAKSGNVEFNSQLTTLREKIDQLDHELFETLAERMKVVDQIGNYKRENNVTVFQMSRWDEILKTRSNWAKDLGLNQDLMFEIFTHIHEAAVRRQMDIMRKEEVEA